jgi:hypothetical protein
MDGTPSGAGDVPTSSEANIPPVNLGPPGEAGRQFRGDFDPDEYLRVHNERQFQPFSIDEPERVSKDELDSDVDRGERMELIRLRKHYAYGLLYMLVAQMIFMNVVLVLTGTHHLKIPSGTMKFYLTGTLGEIFGVVTVAVRFLFSDKKFLGHHGDA